MATFVAKTASRDDVGFGCGATFRDRFQVFRGTLEPPRLLCRNGMFVLKVSYTFSPHHLAAVKASAALVLKFATTNFLYFVWHIELRFPSKREPGVRVIRLLTGDVNMANYFVPAP